MTHRRYPRAWRNRYRAKRASVLANRLLGKRKDTLFLPGDEWKWKALKGRQIGMSSYTNLLLNNPRTGFILNGVSGI